MPLTGEDVTKIINVLQEIAVLTEDDSLPRHVDIQLERKVLPGREEDLLRIALRSENAVSRREALTDLTSSLSERYLVLENEMVTDILEDMLEDGSELEVEQICLLLRQLSLRGTVEEKDQIELWTDTITRIAMFSQNQTSAKYAFEVLGNLEHLTLVDVANYWVSDVDNEWFNGLEVTRLARQLNPEMAYRLRSGMYKLLEGSPTEKVMERIIQVLAGVRRAF